MSDEENNHLNNSPSDIQARQDLALSWSDLGMAAHSNDDEPNAVAALQKAVSIREQLAIELDTPLALDDLAVSWYVLGSFLGANDDRVGEFRARQQNLVIREELMARRRTEDTLEDLASGWRWASYVASSIGDFSGAITALRRAVAIQEQDIAGTDTPRARRSLADSYFRLGESAEASDKPEDALGYYLSAQEQAKLSKDKQWLTESGPHSFINKLEERIKVLRGND